MKTIYLDREFRCHAVPGEGLREVETELFDGKCDAFVDGYRLVPAGESWVREDGAVFSGEMIAPWMDYHVLAAYQEQYEAMLPEIEDMQQALQTLGVTVDG